MESFITASNTITAVSQSPAGRLVQSIDNHAITSPLFPSQGQSRVQFNILKFLINVVWNMFNVIKSDLVCQTVIGFHSSILCAHRLKIEADKHVPTAEMAFAVLISTSLALA